MLLTLFRYTFVGISSFFFLSTNAQGLIESDTITYFPSHRVKDGAPTFYDVMYGRLYYPYLAYRSHRVGTAVVSVTITPEGRLRPINIVNSLGYNIDQVIHQAFMAAEDIWLPDPYAKQDITFMVPINFTTHGIHYHQDPIPESLAPDITVVGYYSGHLRPDAQIAAKANKFYVEKRYRKAKKYLDELIRRNPFDKNLYLMRGNAYRQLGKNDQSCADFMRIKMLLKQPVPAEVLTLCE